MTRKHRIVTCQGSVQLITALAVRDQLEGKFPGSMTSDSLVILGLYAPPEREAAFARVVRELAERCGKWTHIVAISTEEMSALGAQLKRHSLATVTRRLRARLGIEAADEILVSREWLLGNALLLNAFPAARRICYGDGIGFYFSRNYGAPRDDREGNYFTDEASAFTDIRGRIPTLLRQMKHALERAARRRGDLRPLTADFGCFLYPRIFGESPPMPWIPLSPDHWTGVLDRAAGASVLRSKVNVNLEVNHLWGDFAPGLGRDAVVVLTSNLSEALRISVEGEILAYRACLLRVLGPWRGRIVIKAHPRERVKKTLRLAEALRRDFAEVEIWGTEEDAFLPLELVLWQEVKTRVRSGGGGVGLRFIAFGTSALSIDRFFDFPVHFGFGEELIARYFPPEHQEWRRRFEADLRAAMFHRDRFTAQATRRVSSSEMPTEMGSETPV